MSHCTFNKMIAHTHCLPLRFHLLSFVLEIAVVVAAIAAAATTTTTTIIIKSSSFIITNNQ